MPAGLVKGGIIRTAKTKMPRYSIVSSGGTKGVFLTFILIPPKINHFFPVLTEYQVLSTWQHDKWGELSAVAMRAITGRQHQLRATAAALACPILGDRRYGGKAAPRVMLHAAYSGFLARVGKPYHVLCPPDWDLIDPTLPRCDTYLQSISPMKNPI